MGTGLRRFADTEGNTFASDIPWLATERITLGCNPPVNDLYCPGNHITRGQMAAFLVRAFGLPSTNTDFFDDDNGTTFEHDITAWPPPASPKAAPPPPTVPTTPLPEDRWLPF